MLAGLIFSADQEYRLVVTGSRSGGIVSQWSGDFRTSYMVDYVAAPSPGIVLQAQCTEDTGGPDSTIYSLVIPDLGVSTTHTTTAVTTVMTQTFLIEGLKVYFLRSGFWRVEWDAMTWVVEGTTRWSTGSGGITAGMATVPASMPLIGCLPKITAGAAAGPVTPIGCGATGSVRWANSEAVGGYRFDRGDGLGWITPPIDVDAGTPLAGMPTLPTIGGSTTWDASAQAYSYNDGDHDNRTAQLWILPDLTRQVNRIAKGEYGALIVRGGFPEAPVFRSLVVNEKYCDLEDKSSTTTEDEVAAYAQYTSFLDTVDGSASTIEDPLSERMRCPFLVSTTFIDCQASQIVETLAYMSLGPVLHLPGDEISAFVHPTQWLPTFTNFWAAPMWSFALWGPPDTGSYGWEADGTDAATGDYWWLLRQQMMTHPALPEGRDFPGRRANIITEPLLQSGISGIVNGFFGGGVVSFWGVQRFHSQKWVTYRAPSAVLSDPGSWSFPDGTGTGGTTVTIDAGSLVAEAEIGDWALAPYQIAEAMSQVIIAAPTNCDSWRVDLIGADGAEVFLCDSAGTYDRPFALGRKGMATSVQDWGAIHMTDAGVDTRPAKMLSGSIMSDSERIGCPALLPTRTHVKIRLTVVPTDPGADVTWAAPEFENTATSLLKVWPERGAAWSVIEDVAGPGVRWGDQGCWDYGSNAPADPPITRGPTDTETIYDWLNLRRLRLEGRPFEDLIQDELETLFVWGEELTQVAHVARDPDGDPTTLAPIVEGASGPASFLISSLRELPGLAMCPSETRNTDYQAAGDATLECWSATEQRQYHIQPRDIADSTDQRLYAPLPAVTDLFEGDQGATGWSIRWHHLDTLNDDLEWRLGLAAKDLHTYRRWRGGFYVQDGLGSQHLIAYAVRPDLQNFRGRVSAGSATVEAADNALTAWAGVGSTVTAEELCLAVKPYGPILLGVIDVGSYKLYQSTGGSWTLSYTVTSTGTPVNPCVIAGSDGVVFHYWSDGGTVKGRRYDGVGTALGAAFSVSGIGAIDEEGISGDESYGATGERVISLLVVVSGSLTVYTSTDGEAFS